MADEIDEFLEEDVPDEDGQESEAEDSSESDGAEDDSEGNEADEAGQDVGNARHRNETRQEATDDVRRRSSASDTIRTQRARAQKAEREATQERQRRETLERELTEIRARQQAPNPAEVARFQAQEAERLAMMSPEERMDYRMGQMTHQFQQTQRQTELRMMEQADKSAFQTLQASDPLAKKYASEVERIVTEQAARGMTISRENALNYVVGNAIRARATGAKTKQTKAAGERIGRATTKPGRASGNEQSDRSRRGGEDERSLAQRLGIRDF